MPTNVIKVPAAILNLVSLMDVTAPKRRNKHLTPFRHGCCLMSIICITIKLRENKMVEDLMLFPGRKQFFIRQFLKWNLSFIFPHFPQNMLMLSDSRGVPKIYILFLDFACFIKVFGVWVLMVWVLGVFTSSTWQR